MSLCKHFKMLFKLQNKEMFVLEQNEVDKIFAFLKIMKQTDTTEEKKSEI
jgi:hypothetical protein